MLTSFSSNNIINTDFIAHQFLYGYSLKGRLRDFLGDNIPGVPFEVTYADDISDGDRELKEWTWDQGNVPQDQVK